MSESERERLTALVRGRVQGVGYRAFAIEQAHALGLDGYARNLPDGRSVEVVAEGPHPALEQLIERLRRGPRAARVDGVETAWGPARGDLDSFGVRY